MDLERSWHETGAALAKLFLAVLTIAAALAAGIFATDRPSVDELAAAQERLNRLGILRRFVDNVVPVDDHVPRPGDFVLSWDRNQSVAAFSRAPDIVADLTFILDAMVPIAQHAIDSGDRDDWFMRERLCGTLINFLDEEQVRTYGHSFVAAANNLHAIKADLETAGIEGKAAKDLTMAQLVRLNALVGGRMFAISRLASAIRETTPVDPWYCELGVTSVQDASDWSLDIPEDELTWALDSKDPEIVLLSKSRPSELPAIRAQFERERRDLVEAFVMEPTLRVVGFLPPLGFKLGVALLPGMVSIALLVGIAQVWVLIRNMALPNPKIPTGRWQQRVSGYFVFPLPDVAGGKILEIIVSVVCWLSLPVLCTIVKTFAIDRYTWTSFRVYDFTWERTSEWVSMDRHIGEVLGKVPPTFEYQALSVYLLYSAITCTVSLLLLSAVARARAKRLIREPPSSTFSATSIQASGQ